MDVKILSNVNPLKKIGLLSHSKRDQTRSSPIRKLSGRVQFKTKEVDSRTGDHSNGEVVPGNAGIKSKRNDIEHNNRTVAHRNNGSVSHVKQVSHVGHEGRKWFTAKSSKSLGRCSSMTLLRIFATFCTPLVSFIQPLSSVPSAHHPQAFKNVKLK